ncbi:TetR/AcrR family transcriptional regulator [Caulobacter sp. KR2-114]|uniref:TetR/AcrR family transcriptional regulator n=1 Tax=Caulobacter sp. KR2-114 TaxID=3400912 RepID=UPI003C101405
MALKRTYVSPLRQAQAAQTRQSIVEAARVLFDRHGYGATTLDMIAQLANASPNTVYVAFRTKAAILHAILRSVNPEEVVAEAVAAALASSRDPRAQLRHLVDRYVALNGADNGVFSIAASAALTDPDAANWWEAAQNGEWHDLRTLAARWERDGCLKPGLSGDDATNSLWAMTRPSVIRSFVHDCGWSSDQCAAWLTSTMDHALFEGDVPMTRATPPARAATPAASASKSTANTKTSGRGGARSPAQPRGQGPNHA